MSRARNYMFTVFATEGIDLRVLDTSLWPEATFVVYQRELCPKTGREHFQGYLELSKAMPFTSLALWDGLETAHFEVRRGSQKHAIAYCSKDDTQIEGPWTVGEPKNQGQRTDLLEIKREIDKAVSLKRLHQDYFPEFIRFGKAFKEYKRIITKPRDFKPFVILICGPAGTGKSHFATIFTKMLGSVYKCPDKHTGFWCDDYDNQDVFFMDEFDGDRMRPKVFNDVCDRYECVIPCHGSAGHQLISRYIVIVSNYAPKYWWKKRSATQLVQTTRRIDWTIKMIPKNPPPQRPTVVFVNGQFIHQ